MRELFSNKCSRYFSFKNKHWVRWMVLRFGAATVSKHFPVMSWQNERLIDSSALQFMKTHSTLQSLIGQFDRLSSMRFEHIWVNFTKRVLRKRFFSVWNSAMLIEVKLRQYLLIRSKHSAALNLSSGELDMSRDLSCELFNFLTIRFLNILHMCSDLKDWDDEFGLLL